MGFGVHVSESCVKYLCRAKYVLRDGDLVLVSVQSSPRPIYSDGGWEACKPKLSIDRSDEEDITKAESNKKRSVRRAKISAMDSILCNPDLVLFVTLTFDGQRVGDRLDYSSCYACLRPWLSNRVQRHGFKYVACTERQRSGGIHFHMLCNSCGLDLIPATNAHTGQPLFQHGRQVYNIGSWSQKFGYTTAVQIGDSWDDRLHTAKYILKYMSKAEKIGGRYLLKGGDLQTPIYRYSNDPIALIAGAEARYVKTVEIPNTGTFMEWDFV